MYLSEIVIFLSLFLLFITGVILPWCNYYRINDLKKTLEELISYLQSNISEADTDESGKTLQQPSSDPSSPTAQTDPSLKQENFVENKTSPPQDTPSPKKSLFESFFKNLETHFANRFPVWIGGIALTLAGLFLVKYSIENDLLTPTVRVLLGGILGIVLLYSAKWVRNQPHFANGLRIGQSLAGAGIAILYIVSFAASPRLYNLIPLSASFIIMAAVTATALFLSLHHGHPIAILGMISGFLTPLLLSPDGDNAFALFTYLYFVASGLLIISQKNKWWWLSLPTLLISLSWVTKWLSSHYQPDDKIWLSLFLVGISATIIINSKRQYKEDGGFFQLTSILNYIALGSTLIVMGILAGRENFELIEWGLFGLLAIGGIGLAYFNNSLYGFVPWVSMAINAVMFSIWKASEPDFFALTLAAFATLYVASGCFLMLKTRRPALWAGLAGTTGLIYYLLAYYKLNDTTPFKDIPFFWGGVGLALALATIALLLKIQKPIFANNPISDKLKDQLYALFSTVATAFASLAFFIECDREFLSVTIAGEVLVIAWINNRLSIKALRFIAMILAYVFGFLLMPQIFLIVQLTLYSLIEAKLYLLQSEVPIVKWPLFQLGLPAMMLLYSSYLLRKQKEDNIVRSLEVAAIALVAVMGYYFTRNTLHPDQNVLFIKAGFFERGLLTNVLFLYGLACCWIGKRFTRMVFSSTGLILCGIAIFRILYFDMFLYNPLWESQKIEGIAVLNTLWLPYGFPIAWTYLATKELNAFEMKKWMRFAGTFIFILIFTFVSLIIRHIFQGEYLNLSRTTDLEIYTYSVVWIVLGIVLLFAGILSSNKMLRYSSLGVMFLAIGKVFLYDASELEGLYRVLSFFGLGISLIGLSYFYTRFVFRKKEDS